MPSAKRQKAVARRAQPATVPVPDALKAARRALDQQTARVTQLEARLHELTVSPPIPPAPTRVVLTDTEIYWRGRRLLR
jgi:hypothetical protein